MILTKDDLLLYVSKIRFPKHRKGVEYKKFLYKELEDYLSSIKVINNGGTRALSQSFYDRLISLTPLIEANIEAIRQTLTYYDNADYLNTYSTIFTALDNVKESIDFVDLRPTYEYYRIRAYKGKKLERKGLFHVPFNLRRFVNTSRFSMPGMPSLYLSTQPELCWYESGMPNKYYASKFYLVAEQGLKLIDFSVTPFQLSNAIDLDIVNKKQINIKLHEDKLLEFLVMLPFRIASSISVEDKNVTFIHEYVIPQMILSWVKKSNVFDGIRYHTVTSHREAYDWNAYNIVLPIKNINSEGSCTELADLFEISEPKLFSLKEFLKSKSKIDRLNNMYDFVQSEVYNSGRYELHEIEKILFSLVSVLNDLISESSTSNIELMRSLDGLYLAFDNITRNKDTFSSYLKSKSHDPVISGELIEGYYSKFSKFRVVVLIDFYRNSFLRMYEFENFEKLY